VYQPTTEQKESIGVGLCAGTPNNTKPKAKQGIFQLMGYI
jgi:hypothetical protein